MTKTIADVELFLCIVMDSVIILGYLLRSSWRTLTGLFLLTLLAVLDVLMGLRLWSRLWFPLSDVFWAFGFAMLDLVFVWMLVLLWRAHDRPWPRWARWPGLPLPEGGTMSTQVNHPWRATIRTGFAVVVALTSLLPVVVVAGGLEAVPAVGQVLAVAAAVTRVMAVPGVDAFLRQFLPWLAPEPRVTPPPIG